MKFGGSQAPNEYQLPSEVMAALKGRRVQPGIIKINPLGQNIKNRPISPRKPASNSYLNLLKPCILDLGGLKRHTIEINPVTGATLIQKLLTPSLERHRITQSTSDLRFLVDRRYSAEDNPLRISLENPVGLSKTAVEKK